MPKWFIPSNLFTSNLTLETIVLSHKGLVENLLDIFLPNNQIRKPINKISKENKSKCLGSEPWCSYQFGWLKSQIRSKFSAGKHVKISFPQKWIYSLERSLMTRFVKSVVQAQKRPYITCAVSVQEGTGGIVAGSREFTDILWQLMVRCLL